MKKRIRMIAFDLDGTLLTDRKVITEHTKKVLHRAIDQGIVLLPATGRPLNGIPQELFDEFPDIRYAITSNGARILDVRDEKVLIHAAVPREKVKKILDIAVQYDTLREVYFDGQGYVNLDAYERAEEFYDNLSMVGYIRGTRIPVKNLEEMFLKSEKPSDKVQIVFKNREEKPIVLEQLRQISGIAVTEAFSNNIEINDGKVNKGWGLLQLGEYLGVESEEIMAFGDGLNDVSMICAAGVGVAMENAIDEVKAAADLITYSNEEDGVARTIETYILEEE